MYKMIRRKDTDAKEDEMKYHNAKHFFVFYIIKVYFIIFIYG